MHKIVIGTGRDYEVKGMPAMSGREATQARKIKPYYIITSDSYQYILRAYEICEEESDLEIEGKHYKQIKGLEEKYHPTMGGIIRAFYKIKGLKPDSDLTSLVNSVEHFDNLCMEMENIFEMVRKVGK